MSTRSRLVISWMLFTAAAGAQVCYAERKPEPPRPEPPERMPTAEFQQTYKLLNYPKLAVSVTMNETGAEEHRVMFETRLKASFQDDQGDVTIVNPDYTKLKQDYNYDNLVANDKQGAAELLRKEYDADVAILVHLIPTGDESYTGSYVVVDCARGYEMGNWTFTISPEKLPEKTMIVRLSYFTESIAYRIAKDMKRFSGPTQKYTLRFVDLDARMERAVRDALTAMPMMKHVKFRNQEQGWGSALSLFDVRYSGADVLDLREDVREALETLTGSPVEAWRSDEGTVTLAVVPAPSVSVHDIFSGAQNVGIDDPTGTQLLGRLKDAYLRKGEPRIAVILNEPAPLGDRVGDEQRTGARGERTPGEHMAETRMEQQFRNELSNELLDRLTLLNLGAVDLYQVYVDERTQQEKQEAVFDDVELAMLIAARHKCELFILGTGMFVPDDKNCAVRYTTRAFNTSDGKIIGAGHGDATVPRDDAINYLLNTARDKIAGECVGQLVFRMLRAWEPPQRIRIDVSNVKSIAGLKSVAEWMRANLGEHVLYTIEGAFQGGDEGGLGSFDIVYGTDYKRFTDALVAAAPGAPFTLDNQRTTREVIHIKAMIN